MSYTFNEATQSINDKIEKLELESGEISCKKRDLLLQDIDRILDTIEKQKSKVSEATQQAVAQNQAQQQEILIEYHRHNLATNQLIAFFTKSKERVERIKTKEDNDQRFKKNDDGYFTVNASDFSDILVSLKSEYGPSFRISNISGYVSDPFDGAKESLKLNFGGTIRPPMDVMLAKESSLNILYMEGIYFCDKEHINKVIVLVQ